MPSKTRISIALAVGALAVAHNAHAIELDDPVNFQLIRTWSGDDFGVPGRLGALMFSADGTKLYIVGNSESAASALYALPVTRDPDTKRVTGFGQATQVFPGNENVPGLDAGLEVGPGGTLFYTYWNAHHIGERPGDWTAETIYPMAATGVPSSVAGLTFSPHLRDAATSFGMMQVSSWLGNGLYNVPLQPRAGGLYEPGTAVLFASLPQEGTGAIQYIPQGLFTGDLMYVNWNYGEVRMLVIDKATGLPIDDTTGQPTLGTSKPRDRRFAHDLGVGPWGLEFDPLTLDFFVATWDGTPANSIVQFSGPGFANQAPTATGQTITVTAGEPTEIMLAGSDPDQDAITFSMVTMPDHGTLAIEMPRLVYTAAKDYSGSDTLTFRAYDGQVYSANATVKIEVLPAAEEGCSCQAPSSTSAWPAFLAIAALLLVLFIPRRGR